MSLCLRVSFVLNTHQFGNEEIFFENFRQTYCTIFVYCIAFKVQDLDVGVRLKETQIQLHSPTVF